MIGFGKKWNEWELSKAYSVNKPVWIYYTGVFSVVFITYTWYRVFTDEVLFSWLIALMLSLSLIKVHKLIFEYDKFRNFVFRILNNPRKLMILNLSVLIVSVFLILMGVYLY